jgi:hypothetical protein
MFTVDRKVKLKIFTKLSENEFNAARKYDWAQICGYRQVWNFMATNIDTINSAENFTITSFVNNKFGKVKKAVSYYNSIFPTHNISNFL